ncbi:MAG: hypothetical protein PHI73_04490 [Patescibacteria group bacterium]|nr:hypothetical protein [Patescibacteria group bacterium]
MRRVTEVTEWHEPMVEGEEVTAQQLLEEAGYEFDPETHRLVTEKQGEINPDAVIEDGDTLYIEPLEGVDVPDEDEEEDEAEDEGEGELDRDRVGPTDDAEAPAVAEEGGGAPASEAEGAGDQPEGDPK